MDQIYFFKIVIYIIITITLFLKSTYSVLAVDNEISGSAKIIRQSDSYQFDERPVILRNFLEEYNSPLAEYSSDFIIYADRYEIDWRLIPAITGVESTFGKNVPRNSYNAFGWNNGKYRFDSWENSINHVSMMIREKYINDGLYTVEEIGGRYASSPEWPYKVRYFINQIQPYALEFTI